MFGRILEPQAAFLSLIKKNECTSDWMQERKTYN